MEKKNSILIIDPDLDDLKTLIYILRNEYNVLEAANIVQALALYENNSSTITAVLIDVALTSRGINPLLLKLKNEKKEYIIPVIITSNQLEPELEKQAFNQGASDVLIKPFRDHVVLRRINNIVALYNHKLNLEQMLSEQYDIIKHSNEVIVDALSSIIEYRSAESGQHIQRIRTFTCILLNELAKNCPEYALTDSKIDIISSASALHDIGKISIPDAILNKPGPLTPEEYEIIKNHTTYGSRMLEHLSGAADSTYLQYAYDICLYHHERWDGNGYPKGLIGDDIPICAQAVGVADVFDALTSNRVYKPAFSFNQAVTMILNGECGVFSPKLLECFKNVREEFAIRLNSFKNSNKTERPKYSSKLLQIEHGGHYVGTMQHVLNKYYLILRYLHATAIEYDLDNNIYHLLYNPNAELIPYKYRSGIDSDILSVVMTGLHPDDFHYARHNIYNLRTIIFDDGLTRYSYNFRSFSPTENDYITYELTVLRIDYDDDSLHRVLILIRPIDNSLLDKTDLLSPDIGAPKSILAGLLSCIIKCRYDKYYTLMPESTSLLELTGYSKKEIAEIFDNKFVNLIVEEDRSTLYNQLHEQLQYQDSAEFEYRIKHKNGSIVWIFEKCHVVTEENGEMYCYCSLINNNKAKEAQEELHLEIERNQIIVNQTDDIIFEWDISTGKLNCTDNWQKRFGYTPAHNKGIPFISYLNKEDVPLVESKLKEIKDLGTSYCEVDGRIMNSSGKYRWNRFRLSIIRDSAGKALKVVGNIMNIDDEKRSLQNLKKIAERDTLTSLFNKVTVQNKIEEYLKNADFDASSALLIIDLDNFKLVNDTHGHLFGDTVIIRTAREIRKLFRTDDIVGRIGGDEFIVFLKDIHSLESLENRCDDILNILNNMFKEEMGSTPLGCSIGISIFPDNGTTYADLFRNADTALYKAKKHNKNRYVFYSNDTKDVSVDKSLHISAVNSRIDSDEDISINLNNYILDFLCGQAFDQPNVDLSINSLLKSCGMTLGAERTFILEDSPEHATCNNTYEWCSEGIPSEMFMQQNLDYSIDVPGWPNQFDSNGILTGTDINVFRHRQRGYLRLRGVHSTLRCIIRINGITRGILGCDYHTRKIWSKDELEFIHFLAKLTATILSKKDGRNKD